MHYRFIGKTGMSAGIIGLGTEYLDGEPYSVVDETISAAVANGVNIIDVFMPGEEVRKNIGKALAGRRDKVMIQGHLCSTDINQQYDISRDLPTVKKYFENLLRSLGTDYIDFGMLFFIDSDKDYKGVFESPIIEYALELKEKGVIRHLGASSHVAVTARKVVETGLVDLLMFSINPAFDLAPANTGVHWATDEKDGQASVGMWGVDPERLELYRLCENRGVGITVMKTLASGKLLSSALTPFARPLTVGQCIHYALAQPAVASTLIGCRSRAQVEAAVRYLELTDEEKDCSPIIRDVKADFRGKCVYCRHCLPCPSLIDIARIHRCLDAALECKEIPPKNASFYLAQKARGADCISCGSCEERCPFGVPIQENMARAAALFGA